ncbi:micrococcal nuclease-like protein [Janibacter sp. HTCC2649]|uniref:thermonuclease family protein n=1 Tax=Janibacter sp. HTCC2649 TaxID=313589 RepID=UPI0000671899|nr:thermonuclease family protein [Janibacter sp. HTCC2649]EAP97781.1 micrococcal nuclease-like protein [Janibacter sp. HTCC2649]
MAAGSPANSEGARGSLGRTLLRVVVAGVCGLLLLVLGLGAAGELLAIADEGSPSATATTAPASDGPSAAPSAAAMPSPQVASSTTPPTTPPTASPKPQGASKTAAGADLAVVGITDGDTIKVLVNGKTERVRLIGLDAPELKGAQCWSQKASSKMQSLVQGRSVHLARDPSQADRDRYGRLLRHVSTTDGQLVAQVLIEGGFARELTYDGAYEHRDAYQAAEKRAKAKRLGIWSATCAAPLAPPAPRATSAVPQKPSGGCVIKGNINSEGVKIYHVPGGGSYDQTVITESKGERWFCSEQDALDAGWRKARN